jgi:hypothetical protein
VVISTSVLTFKKIFDYIFVLVNVKMKLLMMIDELGEEACQHIFPPQGKMMTRHC